MNADERESSTESAFISGSKKWSQKLYVSASLREAFCLRLQAVEL